MGAIDFSIDVELVKRLRQTVPFDVFVETGTFEGEAVARMLPLFSEIHTIELSETYHAQAEARFRDEPAVQLHHGDSTHVLRSLRPTLEHRSVLYWLDAHWCVADGTAGESSQCPLLGELTEIGTLNERSVVLIDDARLFLSPPPHPHEASDWPRFQQILGRLQQLSDHHELMVINDVIVFFPSALATSMVDHARAQSVDVLASVSRVDALEQERNLLTAALEERLDAINELTRAAEERLVIIEDLKVALEKCESRSSGEGPSALG